MTNKEIHRAFVLCRIIDKLTPNGKVPKDNVLKKRINLLSSSF